MFDGIMIDNNRASGDDIKELYALFEREFNELIKWSIKPTDSNIELSDELEIPMEYTEQKEKFEKTHFKYISPFAFWRCSTNSENINNQWNQITEADFKNDCKTYQIMEFKPNGDVYTTSIFDKWIADPKHRLYETVEFIPYGKVNPTPSHVNVRMNCQPGKGK
jgi:hypothetical protein